MGLLERNAPTRDAKGQAYMALLVPVVAFG